MIASLTAASLSLFLPPFISISTIQPSRRPAWICLRALLELPFFDVALEDAAAASSALPDRFTNLSSMHQGGWAAVLAAAAVNDLPAALAAAASFSFEGAG